MDFSKDIKPIDYFQKNPDYVLDRINETRRPIIITRNGEAQGVIVDPESYRNLLDSLKIMKLLSQSEKEIQQGKVLEQSVFFENLQKSLD